MSPISHGDLSIQVTPTADLSVRVQELGPTTAEGNIPELGEGQTPIAWFLEKYKENNIDISKYDGKGDCGITKTVVQLEKKRDGTLLLDIHEEEGKRYFKCDVQYEAHINGKEYKVKSFVKTNVEVPVRGRFQTKEKYLTEVNKAMKAAADVIADFRFAVKATTRPGYIRIEHTDFKNLAQKLSEFSKTFVVSFHKDKPNVITIGSTSLNLPMQSTFKKVKDTWETRQHKRLAEMKGDEKELPPPDLQANARKKSVEATPLFLLEEAEDEPK